MKSKQGFTLTEVLLAVIIVAALGVALAALTTAASRESSVGNSRIVLRNSFSVALRQIKNDLANYNTILYARGKQEIMGAMQLMCPIYNPSCTPGYIPAVQHPVLLLAKNTRFDGTALSASTPEYVAYCFIRGSVTKLSNGQTNVQPSGADDGGKLIRRVLTSSQLTWNGATPNVCAVGTEEVLLDNLKYIPKTSSVNYPVPLFLVNGWNDDTYGPYSVQNTAEAATAARAENVAGQLEIKLIMELPTYPVVNEAVELLLGPGNGFADSRED